MVLKATRFTPEVLLGSPRRSAAVPDPDGKWAVFTTSTYSFEKHVKSTELRLLEVGTGESHVLTKYEKFSDFRWLNTEEFVALKALDDGTTQLWCFTVWPSVDSYLVASIAAPAANLKTVALAAGQYALLFSAEASPDGALYNETAARPLRSTGRLYNSTYVRHWDRYETKEKNSLWYGKLYTKDARWQLSKLTNALQSTHLECPIRPFGGTDHFDITTDRIIFVSRDPASEPALSTKNNVYLLTIPDWERSPTGIEFIDVGGSGAKSSPIFSPDGTRAAWLAMETNGYESDQNHIYVMIDHRVTNTATMLSGEDDHAYWELSPESLTWTTDGHALLTVVQDKGIAKLFYLPVLSSTKPRVLTQEGSISAVHPLSNGNVFTSGSSLVDSSVYQIIHSREMADNGVRLLWLDSISNHGHKFGLSKDQVHSIWTPANNPKINKHVHSWVFRPSHFDKSQRYPVVYLIHGGPQSAWQDSWSTRWNPAVFAEQGYIVVAPNPTGSTGYGQKFTDAINRNWGGDPYEDIVNLFEWVGKNMKEADNDRAVALGGSYGGYMVNWIQGHSLGRKFKALVNHDGTFSTAGMLATDELYFPFFDLGSTPFYQHEDHKAKLAMYQDWRQWDPAEHLANWSTPELVIHSAQDYRIAIADGLATFNVLQARGIDSQFLTFPDENHWVLKPENSLVWHKVVLNWINKHVGLPPYTTEDVRSDAFYGGVKQEDHAENSGMPTQGNPAI